jgi:hypothetical protein
MTSFDKREHAYEAEFAHQEELKFKVRERAVRLLALWAAERTGKIGQAGEAYAINMVAADVASPTSDTALGHIITDLSGRVSEQDVRLAMDRFWAQADASIRGATPGGRS